MGDYAGLSVAQLGASGILGVAVLFIIFGKLTPKSVLDMIKKEAAERVIAAQAAFDARIADLKLQLSDKNIEIKDWKLAHEAETRANLELSRQNHELLETSRMTHAIARALPTAGSSSTTIIGVENGTG